MLLSKFETCMKKLEQGDDSDLADVHGLVTLYKGYVTSNTVRAIEVIRRSYGGHGYLSASGLPHLYTLSIPSCTYDGDNDILLLQTAQYIVKLIEKANSG